MDCSCKKSQNKTYLMDVVFIRLVLIFLLIVYHALCIHTNSWRPPFESFHRIALYDWIGMLMHCAQLEGMVFISGLLLGYNTTRRPESLSFHSCVIKKAKRILLPCFIFGIIYYVLFFDLTESPIIIVYKILNGCGHLWFLPMIFWCFVFTYLLQYARNYLFNIDNVLILVVSLALLVVNPFGFIPFGIGRLGNYFFYFFLGFSIKSGFISLPKDSNRNICISLFVFFVSFLLYMLMRNCKENFNYNLLMNIVRYIVINVLHLLISLSAIYIMYNLSNKRILKQVLENSPKLIIMSGYCYGVYIYQQFILQILYYKTSLPLHINEWLLPWVAFFITLVLSILFCHYSLKTKFGRFLIG